MKIVERKKYRCPVCGTVVTNLRQGEVSPLIKDADGRSFVVIGFKCPICGSAVSLEHDRID